MPARVGLDGSGDQHDGRKILRCAQDDMKDALLIVIVTILLQKQALFVYLCNKMMIFINPADLHLVTALKQSAWAFVIPNAMR